MRLHSVFLQELWLAPWIPLVGGLSLVLFAGFWQSDAAAQNPQAGPRCESYCDPFTAGTPVIEVAWELSDRLLPAEESRKRAAQQTVDVTVFADGFERGLFSSLPVMRPQARFALKLPAGAPQTRISGLAGLVVTDVATTSDAPAAKHLRLLSGAAVRRETLVLRVEGVEPGLNYSWRVPSPAGPRLVVTCRATACPADAVVERAKPRARGKK